LKPALDETDGQLSPALDDRGGVRKLAILG